MSKIKWTSATKRDKKSESFLRDQWKLWAAHDEEGVLKGSADQDDQWRKYDDAIFDMEEKNDKAAVDELSKEINSEVVKADDVEEFERHVAFWEAWFETNDVYFVGHENKYYLYNDETHMWVDMSPDGLRNYHNINGRLKRLAFEEVMKTIGRKKLRAEFSHRKLDDETLNMMRRDHWLKPQKGKMHQLFEILMETLGAQNQEASDHIEQVLWWKYSHPEDYSIPCLVINGQGGVGKNTLADHVMPTIFGRSQVAVLDIESITGQFSGQLKGKTFVFLDEVVADMSTASKMKRRVGNKTIDVNNKGGKQEIIDNTAMYMCGGNDRTGAVLLDDSQADRRWSIIIVKKSLIDIAMERWDCNKAEALEIWSGMKHVYDDPDEVSRFLGHLEAKWSGMTTAPDGYHGADYKQLLDVQKGPLDMVFEGIFHREGFDYIFGEDLYEIYKLTVEKEFPSQRGRMKNSNTFYQAARDWIEKEGYGYEWKRLNIKLLNGEKTTKHGFSAGGRSTVTPNTEKYIEYSEYGKNSVIWSVTSKYVEAVDGALLEDTGT